jgi:hypothetical protein
MTVCVIMHNMIIENQRDQELSSSFYDLMEVPVQIRRREERLAQFIFSYLDIHQTEVHDQL